MPLLNGRPNASDQWMWRLWTALVLLLALAAGLCCAATSGMVPVTANHSPFSEAQLNAHSESVQTLSRPFWFHVPKCGSSWLITMFFWVCPTLSESIHHTFEDQSDMMVAVLGTCPFAPVQGLGQGHGPYRRDEHQGQAVGLFRHPLDRVISLFYYWRGGEPATHDEVAEFARRISFHPEASSLGVQQAEQSNTYIGMLLGHERSEIASHKYTKRDFLAAVDVLVNEFAFVGLTEHYNESVCLFHAVHGGSVHEMEYENIHETDTSARDPHLLRNRAAGKYLREEAIFREQGWSEGWDAGIYKVATNLFYANLRKYPECFQPTMRP